MEVRALLEAFMKMDKILAHDVVADEDDGEAIQERQNPVENPVDIPLPDKTSASSHRGYDSGSTHLSPSWKSTQECGWKKPCRVHAATPIPVASYFP